MLRYVPAVVLLAMYGQYIQPLRSVLSFLVALSGFALYLRLAPRGAALRLLALFATWGAVGYVAGVGGVLFPILVAVYEFLVGRRLLLGAVALLLAVGRLGIAQRCDDEDDQ